jgi:hypothetical protein
LIQGWRGVEIAAGVECVGCKRVTPEPTDSSYADPARPKATDVMLLLQYKTLDDLESGVTNNIDQAE